MASMVPASSFGHMRQRDIGVMAHPAVPVAAADAGGLHAQDHRQRTGTGSGT